MSTRGKNNSIDGWAGMAEELAKNSNVTKSQCSDCLNKVGTHACKEFGERPNMYASVLANVKCPERKVK